MTKILAAAVAIALATGLPATAQVTSRTEVKHDTSMDNGVATHTTKVEHVTKRKTRRPKKILGVKVGHKTVTHKVTRETKTSSNGDTSTSVQAK